MESKTIAETFREVVDLAGKVLEKAPLVTVISLLELLTHITLFIARVASLYSICIYAELFSKEQRLYVWIAITVS